MPAASASGGIELAEQARHPEHGAQVVHADVALHRHARGIEARRVHGRVAAVVRERALDAHRLQACAGALVERPGAAYRIGEVVHRPAGLGKDPRRAGLDLIALAFERQAREHRVVDGVAADGHPAGGHFPDLVPVHPQAVDAFGRLLAGFGAQAFEHAGGLVGRKRLVGSKDRADGGVGAACRGQRFGQPWPQVQPRGRGGADAPGDLVPPGQARAVDEAGGDEEGGGQAVPAQDRVGHLVVVQVAVVEGDQHVATATPGHRVDVGGRDHVAVPRQARHLRVEGLGVRAPQLAVVGRAAAVADAVVVEDQDPRRRCHRREQAAEAAERQDPGRDALFQGRPPSPCGAPAPVAGACRPSGVYAESPHGRTPCPPAPPDRVPVPREAAPRVPASTRNPPEHPRRMTTPTHHRSRRLLLACLVACAAAWAAPAAARTWHVSGAGSDTHGNGSAERPFRTIRRVIDPEWGLVSPGDVVELDARPGQGRYDECDVRLRVRLTLRSAPGGGRAHIHCDLDTPDSVTVQIDPDASGSVLSNLEISGGHYYGVMLQTNWYQGGPDSDAGASDVVLEDLLVRDTGRDGIKITPRSRRVTIRRVEIHGTGRRDPSNADGIDNVNGDGMVVEDSYIHDTATTGLYFKGGARDVVVQRNRIENTGDAGILAGFDTSVDFFDLEANPRYHEAIRGVVRNNVVRNTRYAGIGLYATLDTVVAHNTIIDAAREGQAALFFGIVFQDWHGDAGRPPNTGATLVNNLVVQEGGNCVEIRWSPELGGLSALAGQPRMDYNAYPRGSRPCRFLDQRPESPLPLPAPN